MARICEAGSEEVGTSVGVMIKERCWDTHSAIALHFDLVNFTIGALSEKFKHFVLAVFDAFLVQHGVRGSTARADD